MILPNRIRALGRKVLSRTLGVPASRSPHILDSYVRTAPSSQNAVDIFKGEWASQLPLEGVQAGAVDLFADDRIQWALSDLGGLQGQRVLELGPLEGGHSAMLEAAGAAEVIAVEANTRAYLKCLVVKELFQLRRVRFLCGDFNAYLSESKEQFDTCIACGVLYHMEQPHELIRLIAGHTRQVMVWTHYYDHEAVQNHPSSFKTEKERGGIPAVKEKFSGVHPVVFDGQHYNLHRYEYYQALNYQGFCGGSNPYSHWMEREEILGAFRHYGFDRIHVNFDNPTHINGPSFAFTAVKSGT